MEARCGAHLFGVVPNLLDVAQICGCERLRGSLRLTSITKPQVIDLLIAAGSYAGHDSGENIVHNRKFVPKKDESVPKKKLLQHMHPVIRVIDVDE